MAEAVSAYKETSLLSFSTDQKAKANPTRKLPHLLGLSIQMDYEAGEMRYFGNKNQSKGRELLILILSDVINRTVDRDKPVVQLNADAMRDRYGRRKKKNVKSVDWNSAKDFLIEKDYLRTDGTYCPNEKNMAFCLNPKFIDNGPNWYFPLKEQTIINKIENEKNRFAKSQCENITEFINREQSVKITIENLKHLDFDYQILDEICKTMLFVPLFTLRKWLEDVNSGANFSYPDPFPNPSMGSLPYEGIIGYMRGRYEEYSTHSVVTFPPGREVKGSKNALPTEQNRSSCPVSGTPEDVKSILRDEYCRDTETGDTVKYSSTFKRVWSPEERAMMRRRHLFASLVALHLNMNERSVFTDDKGGRLYSPLVPLKREARPALRYRNSVNSLEYVVSFDIKSSQPWFLGIAVLNYYKSIDADAPQNVFDYLELVEKEDIYYDIVSFTGKDRTEENRDKIKKAVMYTLFKNKYTDPTNCTNPNFDFIQTEEFFKVKFPVIWEWIKDNQGFSNKSKVPVMMQKAEADYFIGRVIPELNSRGIWCLTIHDSVIVREQHAEEVKRYLEDSIFDCFGRIPGIKPEVYGK